MPYLKFDKPKHIADNRGSCSKLINYLAKEDVKSGLEKELFFNHSDSCIPAFRVIDAIDKNKQGLMKTDAKFYSGSINLSQKELAFLNNDIDKMKEFTVSVFNEYAQNFEKGLTIDDINWFAKIEHKRYYHGTDKEVLQGKAKQGEEKPGLNTHVHFIIGRKSTDGKKKLSPVSNHRNTKIGPVTGGFDRDRFKSNCEKIFDKQFLYNRGIYECYQTLKTKKNGSVEEKEKLADFIKQNENKVIDFLKLDFQHKREAISFYIDQLNKMHGGEKLDKTRIIQSIDEPYMSGAVFKSLINLSTKIESTCGLKDTTGLVLNYANFINRSVKDLPLEMKEDKIRRACYDLHYGQKEKKWNLNIPLIMDYERSNGFTGKVINDIIDLTYTINSNKDIPIKSSFDYLFTKNYFSLGATGGTSSYHEDIEENKKKKKRKKNRINDQSISR